MVRWCVGKHNSTLRWVKLNWSGDGVGSWVGACQFSFLRLNVFSFIDRWMFLSFSFTCSQMSKLQGVRVRCHDICCCKLVLWLLRVLRASASTYVSTRAQITFWLDIIPILLLFVLIRAKYWACDMRFKWCCCRPELYWLRLIRHK